MSGNEVNRVIVDVVPSKRAEKGVLIEMMSEKGFTYQDTLAIQPHGFSYRFTSSLPADVSAQKVTVLLEGMADTVTVSPATSH
ncbi:hypothetical protein CIG19_06825 [Enterobacterales bacterium CwR94]|nr:hypothetical protein CIG19_06825 [Enterobacterales bacterium CwR94]